MKATVLDDGNLEISVDSEEQAELREAQQAPYFDSDNYMCDFFERLTCNSEYDWIRPEDIGALTDAPILGLRQFQEVDDDEQEQYEISHAWAFMDYQIISVQGRLLDEGKAVFIKG